MKKLAEEKLVKFAEPCVVECHESKSKCQECKSAAGMPSVDLSNFRATSLQMKGKDLKRESNKQDATWRGRNRVRRVPSPSVDVDRLDTGRMPETEARADTGVGVGVTRTVSKSKNDIFHTSPRVVEYLCNE